VTVENPKKMMKLCMFVDGGTGKQCEKKTQYNGLCWSHGGRRLCKVADCSQIARMKGFCLAHIPNSEENCNPNTNASTIIKCTTPQCDKAAIKQSLCQLHYYQQQHQATGVSIRDLLLYLKHRNTTLSQNNTQLQTLVEKTHAELERSRVELADSKQRYANLLAQVQEKATDEHKRRNYNHVEIVKLNSKIHAFEVALKKANGQLEEQTAKANGLELAVSRARAKYQAERKKNEQLKNDTVIAEATTKREQEFDAERKKLQLELADVRAQLMEQETRNEQFTLDRDELRGSMESLKDRMRKLHKRTDQLYDRFYDYKDHHMLESQLGEQLRDLQEKHHRLELNYDQLDREYDSRKLFINTLYGMIEAQRQLIDAMTMKQELELERIFDRKDEKVEAMYTFACESQAEQRKMVDSIFAELKKFDCYENPDD
jgi:chromosome segregation ATPase